jgi:hypothetical protein
MRDRPGSPRGQVRRRSRVRRCRRTPGELVHCGFGVPNGDLVRHILLRWLAPTYILSAKYSRSSTTSEAPRRSTRPCVSEVAASGSPRPPEISCSWWRPATWTSSPAMRARRCIFVTRGSTTITLCAGRAGTPSRSPVQPRNDGLMPWLSLTGTPTSATPWWCSASASVRTARRRAPGLSTRRDSRATAHDRPGSAGPRPGPCRRSGPGRWCSRH